MVETRSRSFSKLATFVTADGAILGTALSADAKTDYIQLQQQGTLSVTTGTSRWNASDNLTISEATAYIGETANSVVRVLINKNGDSVNSLSIASGQSSKSNTNEFTMVAGDYLTVDITSVGTGDSAGSDLGLILKYSFD
jgi:hypothetical protein